MFDSCLDTGADADPAEVYREEWRRAAKPHECCECGRTIPIGEQHEYVTGLWDGGWSTYRTCRACARIRASLFHSFFYGMLWEDIAYAYGGCGGNTEEDWDTEDDDWLDPVSRYEERR